MNQPKLIELLQEIQVPDTQRVKAATSELRKNYYPYPESLVWLLQTTFSHGDPGVRQQAAVESVRLVDQHWNSLNTDQKQTIREKILQAILNEQTSSVRHSSSRVITAIANIDAQDGQWPQLPGLLANATTSDVVAHREIVMYIIFSLLDEAYEGFDGKIQELFQLFNTTIKDPESIKVRINTLLCLSRVAIMIEPDNDQASVDRLNDIFPELVAVLKAAIDENDENHIMQAFEFFQTLLGCESALLNKHFKDLLTFMIDISANTKISDEARTQALSFLMQSAKFRKMKIQGMKDMGELLTIKSIQIATEISDDLADDDEDDESSPSKSALSLLDILATSLPPRQVIIPLLNVLPQYVQNENPKYRQAGILALGMCVEGAPDFISGQLKILMPIVLQLLNDTDVRVRSAALNGVARLADDLAEDLDNYHEQLIPILLKNLDSAISDHTDALHEPSRNIQILKSSCGALDSVCRGINKSTMQNYLPELVPRLGRLLNHPDLDVRSSAVGAIGSIAESAQAAFLPYFETTLKVLSEFLTIKDSTEELDLRGVVCDAIGSIATAVGADAFKPYVNNLMQSSEEVLHLDHPRLRESSYILWGTLAKIYGADFLPFLDGVVKSIFKCLAQDETDLSDELTEGPQELLGQDVVIAGKRVLVPPANSSTDFEDMEDGDDLDWEDDFANTAIAMEKEVAIEVLGDVMSHARANFMPYFEEAIKISLGLVEHGYDGLRKGTFGTLWRSYACLWALMEDETGQKWTSGLPLKQQPSGELLKLGELVTTATTKVWQNETNRAVVTDINRNVAATLNLCGPAILTHNDFTERTIATCVAIITNCHPCQQDLGEDSDTIDAIDEESSEYDWLVIDTALDVINGLSKAIGAQFAEAWKIFQKPIMKFASSQVSYERSTAVGVIAECTANMGEAVSPYTKTLLTLLLHRLGDEDAETKSNAAFAIGLLIFHSTASNEYLDFFPTILSKLESLLQTPNASTMDNAAGCICRMIMAHVDRVPLQEILPTIIDLLPLKEDFEENTPIYDCITGLYNQSHPVVLSQSAKLTSIFASVLGEPKTQLEVPTRNRIISTIQMMEKQEPALIHNNQALVTILRENLSGAS